MHHRYDVAPEVPQLGRLVARDALLLDLPYCSSLFSCAKSFATLFLPSFQSFRTVVFLYVCFPFVICDFALLMSFSGVFGRRGGSFQVELTACSHDVVFSHFFQGLVLPFSLSFLLDFFPCSSQSFFFFLNFWVYLFIIYLFMAVLSLRFCARAFSSCGKWGPLFNVVRGPLITAASLVAEHRLQTRRLGNCGSRAQLLCSMWDLPRPGLEPVSPALAGRFSTTAPPGKPSQSFLNLPMDFTFPLLHFSPFTCRLPGRIKPLVDISASSTAYCGLAFQLCLMIKV